MREGSGDTRFKEAEELLAKYASYVKALSKQVCVCVCVCVCAQRC